MANYTIEQIKKAKHIHFIGIGGVSMSTLAAIAKKRGHEVTGSDRSCSDITKSLENMGVKINYEHKRENVNGADLVVYTWAISDDNDEVAEAKEKGIPMIARCDFLGELMRLYDVCIGVSGTHGKSTTTGMISHIFLQNKLDPTVACGASLPELHGAYTLGDGKHFIYESCEYRDSFLSFHPDIAIILNVDHDHVDYFPTLDSVIKSFKESIKDSSVVIYNKDDQNACEAVKGYQNKTVGIGIEADDAQIKARNLSQINGKWSYDLYINGEKSVKITLGAPGKHNVYNSLCAIAAALECGIEPGDIASTISTFSGVDRRMQFKGEFMGAKVFDDYAHHPEELAATLQTANEMNHNRVFCIFQPHTYTRAREFASEFANVLSRVDLAILADVYAAREKSDGTTSKVISDKMQNGIYLGTNDKIINYLKDNIKENDIILAVGAGDIYKLADKLCEKA